MLLALVEEERLQDVGRDGVAGQVQVLLVGSTGLEDYWARNYYFPWVA